MGQARVHCGTSEALVKFRSSMTIDQEKWRDGTGYDLEALAEVPEEERAIVEEMLIGGGRDWRDLEALGALRTPAAIAALVGCLRAEGPATRYYAARELHGVGVIADLVPFIHDGLSAACDDSLFSRLIDGLNAARRPESVGFLLARLRSAPESRGVHLAASLFYISGKTEEKFDWKHRPLFLRFGADEDPAERQAAFEEVCRVVGV